MDDPLVVRRHIAPPQGQIKDLVACLFDYEEGREEEGETEEVRELSRGL